MSKTSQVLATSLPARIRNLARVIAKINEVEAPVGQRTLLERIAFSHRKPSTPRGKRRLERDLDLVEGLRIFGSEGNLKRMLSHSHPTADIMDFIKAAITSKSMEELDLSDIIQAVNGGILWIDDDNAHNVSPENKKAFEKSLGYSAHPVSQFLKMVSDYIEKDRFHSFTNFPPCLLGALHTRGMLIPAIEASIVKNLKDQVKDKYPDIEVTIVKEVKIVNGKEQASISFRTNKDDLLHKPESGFELAKLNQALTNSQAHHKDFLFKLRKNSDYSSWIIREYETHLKEKPFVINKGASKAMRRELAKRQFLQGSNGVTRPSGKPKEEEIFHGNTSIDVNLDQKAKLASIQQFINNLNIDQLKDYVNRQTKQIERMKRDLTWSSQDEYSYSETFKSLSQEEINLRIQEIIKAREKTLAFLDESIDFAKKRLTQLKRESTV